MSRLSEDLENVKKAVAEVRRQASPNSPLLLGSVVGAAVRGPTVQAAQAEALEAIQTMLEEIMEALEALETGLGQKP